MQFSQTPLVVEEAVMVATQFWPVTSHQLSLHYQAKLGWPSILKGSLMWRRTAVVTAK